MTSIPILHKIHAFFKFKQNQELIKSMILTGVQSPTCHDAHIASLLHSLTVCSFGPWNVSQIESFTMDNRPSANS